MSSKNIDIVIFGAGETAHLSYEYFTHDPNYTNFNVVAFCVDTEYYQEDTYLGLPVVRPSNVQKEFPNTQYKAFAAASSGQLNRTREKLYKKVKDLGYECVSYISAKAFVWHNVEIGENCLILEDNTLQPFTKIGDNVVLWSGNHIGHRTVIKDHVFVTSHVVISGYCTIGEYSFIGVNSSFADNLSIGKNNFIAMGTTIVKSTQDNQVWSGPAGEMRKIEAKKYCRVRTD